MAATVARGAQGVLRVFPAGFVRMWLGHAGAPLLQVRRCLAPLMFSVLLPAYRQNASLPLFPASVCGAVLLCPVRAICDLARILTVS